MKNSRISLRFHDSFCRWTQHDGVHGRTKTNEKLAFFLKNFEQDEHSVNLLNSDNERNISLLNKRQYTFKSGKRYAKRTIISFYLSCLRKFTKPDVIYEDMKCLNLIFPVRNRFQELKYKKYQADYQIRNRLKQIFFKVYVSNQKRNPLKLDNNANDNNYLIIFILPILSFLCLVVDDR